MSDDKKPDASHEADDQETNEAKSGDKKKPVSPDSAAPADDDIIIK